MRRPILQHTTGRTVPTAILADVKVAAADVNSSVGALRLLRGDAVSDQAAAASLHGLAAGDVIAASVSSRVEGAIVAHVAAGRVGWIWPPVVDFDDCTSEFPGQIARALVDAATAKLAAAGCTLAQALLRLDDTRGDYLRASGFVLVTEMIRMERECVALREWKHEAAGLEFVTLEQSTERDFEDVIEQTYRGSQDCPELDGVRTAAEALESYRTAGSFRPDLWFLARHGGNWVGCVLLASFPAESCCELQYVGVIPQARGRQIGRILCERALVAARRAGASKLFLSVDSRNHSAIKHYHATGFIETERRRVYIRTLAPTRSE